jgi:SMP-30/Gluconolactonase/LRE-like region
MVQVKFPSFPMCFDWLPDGSLLVVSARDGLVLRRESNGKLVTHADLSGVAKRGNPWNEIVVDGRGNAYINNVGFDFPGGEFAPGVIALLKPDSSIQQVAGGIAFPNGMAVTPENLTLIVAESYGKRLAASTLRLMATYRTDVCGPTSLMACLTASALMPTMQSGTPTFPISDAWAFVKGVKCCRQSHLTVVALPACSGALNEARCSSWRPSGMAQRKWLAEHKQARY